MEGAKTVEVDKKDTKVQAKVPTFIERVKRIREVLRQESASGNSINANLKPLFAWNQGDNWGDGFKDDNSWQKGTDWDNYDRHYKPVDSGSLKANERPPSETKK